MFAYRPRIVRSGDGRHCSLEGIRSARVGAGRRHPRAAV